MSEGGIGGGHEAAGRDVGAWGRGSFEDQGEGRKSSNEGDSEVCQGVDRKVVSWGRGWDQGAPVQGEVEGGEATLVGTGGVVYPKDEQRGERGGEVGCGRVVGGGGARYANGRQVSPIFTVGVHWGQACFAQKKRGGSRVEVVCDPSGDAVRERVERGQGPGVGCYDPCLPG